MKLSTESNENEREREFVCACACVLLQKKRKALMRSKKQQNQHSNRINKVMEQIFVKNHNEKKNQSNECLFCYREHYRT